MDSSVWERFSAVRVITEPGSEREVHFRRFSRRMGFDGLVEVKKAVRPTRGINGMYAGEVGCWQSHLQLAADYLESGESDPLLVFEDDCWHTWGMSPEDEIAAIGRAMDRLPECDVFKLGYSVIGSARLSVLENRFLRINQSLCTHALAYFPSAARAMVDCWNGAFSEGKVIDVWLNDNVRQIQSADVCFSQYGHKSSIGKYNIPDRDLSRRTKELVNLITGQRT